VFIKRTTRRVGAKTYINHRLVESVATVHGPRHRTICSLGSLAPAPVAEWRGLAHKLAAARSGQTTLVPDAVIDELAARTRPSTVLRAPHRPRVTTSSLSASIRSKSTPSAKRGRSTSGISCGKR